jgi:hypothetical protein
MSNPYWVSPSLPEDGRAHWGWRFQVDWLASLTRKNSQSSIRWVTRRWKLNRTPSQPLHFGKVIGSLMYI